jgi:hypothetical protein
MLLAPAGLLVASQGVSVLLPLPPLPVLCIASSALTFLRDCRVARLSPEPAGAAAPSDPAAIPLGVMLLPLPLLDTGLSGLTTTLVPLLPECFMPAATAAVPAAAAAAPAAMQVPAEGDLRLTLAVMAGVAW